MTEEFLDEIKPGTTVEQLVELGLVSHTLMRRFLVVRTIKREMENGMTFPESICIAVNKYHLTKRQARNIYNENRKFLLYE